MTSPRVLASRPWSACVAVSWKARPLSPCSIGDTGSAGSLRRADAGVARRCYQAPLTQLPWVPWVGEQVLLSAPVLKRLMLKVSPVVELAVTV